MWDYIKNVAGLLDKKEKIFVVAVITIILLLTLLPLLPVINAADFHFIGGTFIGRADKLIYFSQIEEVRQGSFLIHNLYTSEPQVGYFSPLWLALGWFSKFTTLTPIFTFHLFRLILGFILLYLIYLFLTQIFSDINWRKIAFVAISFSSGFGIFTIFRPWTDENAFRFFGSDIWFNEGNTFLTINHSPLFIFSQICILLIFWWVIARLDTAKNKEVVLMGLLGCFLGIIHPYDLVIIFSVVSAWFLFTVIKKKLWPWQNFIKLLIFFLISFLPILYFFILKNISEGFAGWASQNVTLSPLLHNYMIGYGLFFILFLFGIVPALKNKNKYSSFLVVWSIISWLLLYAPLQSQRRLGNGIHIPMVIIGIMGAIFLLNKIKGSGVFKRMINTLPLKFIILTIIILLAFSTNIFLVGGYYFYNSISENYLSRNEYRAIYWLKDNIDKSDIILSENIIGNIIPSISGRYVYLGHGHQTNNWEIKKFEVEEWFFKNNTVDSLKYQWLLREKIDYVYFSYKEKALGDFRPYEKDYLKQVYKNEDVEIYRVINN